MADGELSFEESHELFRGFFTDGFPWEVLRVLSGPPTVLFTWRHWGVAAGRCMLGISHTAPELETKVHTKDHNQCNHLIIEKALHVATTAFIFKTLCYTDLVGAFSVIVKSSRTFG